MSLHPSSFVRTNPSHNIQNVLVVLFKMTVENRLVMRDPISESTKVIQRCVCACPV